MGKKPDASAMSADVLQRFGRSLRGIRERSGKTQREFAEDLGFSYTFLSDLENGKRNMTVERMGQIAEAAGAKLSDMISSCTASKSC